MSPVKGLLEASHTRFEIDREAFPLMDTGLTAQLFPRSHLQKFFLLI